MGCGSSKATQIADGNIKSDHGGFLDRARRRRNQDKPHGFLVNWIDSLEDTNKEMANLLGRWTAEGEELTLFANSKDMRGEQEAANDEVAAFVKLAEERHASAVAAHVTSVQERQDAKAKLDEVLKLLRHADDKTAAREQAEKVVATAKARLVKATRKRDRILNNSESTEEQRTKARNDVNEHEHDVKMADEALRMRTDEENTARSEAEKRRQTDVKQVIIDITAAHERSFAQAHEDFAAIRAAAQRMASVPVTEPEGAKSDASNASRAANGQDMPYATEPTADASAASPSQYEPEVIQPQAAADDMNDASADNGADSGSNALDF